MAFLAGEIVKAFPTENEVSKTIMDVDSNVKCVSASFF